jgi:hypothetical protein
VLQVASIFGLLRPALAHGLVCVSLRATVPWLVGPSWLGMLHVTFPLRGQLCGYLCLFLIYYVYWLFCLIVGPFLDLSQSFPLGVGGVTLAAS